MATPKQVKYALYLLSKAGYSTRFMDSTFKRLGASMRERSGSVEAWLTEMSAPKCSELIDRLNPEK